MSITHSYRPCHYRLSFSPWLKMEHRQRRATAGVPTWHAVSPFACGFLVAAMGHHGDDDDDAGFTTVERRGGDSGVAGMDFLCTYVCSTSLLCTPTGLGANSLFGARASLGARR